MTNLKYQAFLSYSHEADATLAASLQSSLSRLAKPWYRVRSMRIFLDKSSLSANPALGQSIQDALGQSEHFLLLASPASAASHWVHREVEWWLQNRSAAKLILCLTGGEITWDDHAADFDWEKTTAIPSSLKGTFPAEPLYADFRAAKTANHFVDSDPAYRSALLDVGAPLLGRAKDDLDGEDIRLHRRAVRTAWAAALITVVLGLAAGTAMILAHQRQKIAASRALASQAGSQVQDRSLAMLLSVESRRIADTVESRRALLAAIQRVPNADTFLWGHTSAVTKAVFSPDGQTILSAGWDDRIILWSAATHQPIGQPIQGPKGLVSAAFRPDGTQFATAGSRSIVIWSTASRQPIGAPLHADEDFVHVAFSSQGKLLAASTDGYGGHPATVLVWDLVTRQTIGAPVEGSGFAFSPDDSMLAIGRYRDLIFYDLRSHRVIQRPLTGHTKNITSIAFSPDGTIVAAGAEDNTILLWDVRSRRLLGTLTGHLETVTSLLFDPDGEVLFSGSADGTIIQWDLQEIKPASTPVKSFGAAISSIFLSPDGHLRALALENDRAILINVNQDPPLGRRIRAPDSGSSNIAFSPDGRLLASAGEFGDIELWDVATGAPNGPPLSGHEKQVSSLAYAPNGKMLVSGSMDGTMIFWDMVSRNALGPPLQVFRSPVWSLACSPDSSKLAAAGDAALVFWDLATRKQLGPPITSQKDRIWALAFSPDGSLLASAGNSLVVSIWKNDRQGGLVRTLGSPVRGDDWELMPAGVSFHPNGTLLAMSTPGHSVTLWNVRSGRPLPPLLYGHTEAVSSVAFSGDGKVLASGGADGQIRLWDVDSHEWIGTLGTESNAVHGIAFSPREGILASVSEDDSIVFWDVNFDDWMHRACQIANRNLTRDEWNTYLGNRPYRKTCSDL
ncbi:MAG: TIR domain-containing protein [Acidobacteriaceae bacterium]